MIGVFTAFTLSQAGMVRYWLRTRDPGWSHRIVVNTVGATATGMVTLIVIWTKFTEGAWLVIVAIPLLVLSFLGDQPALPPVRAPAAGGCLRGAGGGRDAHRGAALGRRDRRRGRECALVRAAHRAREAARDSHAGRHTDSGIRPRWYDFAKADPQLEVLAVDEGRSHAVLEEVWRLPRGEADFVTVIVPEQFKRASLLSAAARTSFRLKLRLMSEPGVVVTDVTAVRGPLGEGPPPQRLVCRVLLANMHAGALRAANYARSLEIEDTRAVSFAFSTRRGRRVRENVERAPGSRCRST